MIDFSFSEESQLILWGLFLRGVGLLTFVQFFHNLFLILPLGGSRGIYPCNAQLRVRAKWFPTWHRFLYWPTQFFMTLVGGASDTALLGYVGLGAISSALYVISGHPIAFAGILIAFLAVAEPSGWIFPWHKLLGEVLWICTLGGSSIALPVVTSRNVFQAVSLPPAPLAFSLWLLTFRVMFGFGKTKFQGSSKKDWMYVRPFLVGIPMPTPFGLWAFHNMPRLFFFLSYGVFFFSEVVVPFGLFLPMPYRAVAGMFIFLLMFGIQLTGNFGFFNILTALLVLPLGLNGQLLTWPSTITECIFVAYCLLGVPMLAFNSWAAFSWFMWPSLARVSRPIAFTYELLVSWRILHSYGVFPPDTIPPQRNVPVFDISNDGGKTWHRLKYRYQPSGTGEPSVWTYGLHPTFDFAMVYPLGSGGYLMPVLNCRNPVANSRQLYVVSVARNIIEHGTVLQLFANPPAINKSKPPTHVRVVYVTLVPNTEAGWGWRALPDTTVDLPAVSKADLDGPLLPRPFVDSLDHTDAALSIWRKRSAPYQSILRDTLSALLRTSGRLPGVPDTLLPKLRTTASIAEAADLHDAVVREIGPPQFEVGRAAILRAALAVLNDVEDPLYFNNLSPSPTHFHIYQAALAAVVGGFALPLDPKERQEAIRTAAGGTDDDPHRALGLRAFVFCNAPILRREVSLLRRTKAAGTIKPSDPALAPVLPGAAFVMLPMVETLPFFRGWRESLHHFAFNAAMKEFDYKGTQVIANS